MNAMNLIEKLGGYEKAKEVLYLQNKEWVLTPKQTKDIFGFEFTIESLNNALLEHRRENNIFEVGDKVVFSNKCALNHSIWQVISVNDGAVIVAPICKYNGRVVVESNTPVQYPYSIQHATPSEIKAGHRL